ncbi:MAG TPA: zf-HC2 domain-containing protein [Acidimicrobiia bacterium]|jgi:anti-sigma factor RsiW|nr:zf-HC2 domain-containing protein [Acidimicrobiia bacterium]
MSHPAELISAYLDGELHEPELGDLVRHLGSCGRCSVEMEQIQSVRSAVRSLPLLELPEDIAPYDDARLVPLPSRKGIWIGAAAAVVAVVIAVAALLTPSPGTVTVDDLNSRFGARVSLDPAFGPAKVVVPLESGR